MEPTDKEIADIVRQNAKGNSRLGNAAREILSAADEAMWDRLPGEGEA